MSGTRKFLELLPSAPPALCGDARLFAPLSMPSAGPIYAHRLNPHFKQVDLTGLAGPTRTAKRSGASRRRSTIRHIMPVGASPRAIRLARCDRRSRSRRRPNCRRRKTWLRDRGAADHSRSVLAFGQQRDRPARRRLRCGADDVHALASALPRRRCWRPADTAKPGTSSPIATFPPEQSRDPGVGQVAAGMAGAAENPPLRLTGYPKARPLSSLTFSTMLGAAIGGSCRSPSTNSSPPPTP